MVSKSKSNAIANVEYGVKWYILMERKVDFLQGLLLQEKEFVVNN